MKNLMIAAALAAIATGCICVNKNDGGESNLRPCIVKDRIHEMYTVSDKTVTASEQIQSVCFISWGATASHVADQVDLEYRDDDLFKSTAAPHFASLAKSSGFGPIAKAKNGAYAKACEAAGCDHIAGARYTITTEDYIVYKKVKAEITGYPVKLVGVEVLPACPKAACAKACCCPKMGCPKAK